MQLMSCRLDDVLASRKLLGQIGDMLGRTYDAQVCSIARALEVVGERWSILIVRDALFAGSTRYGDCNGASASRPTSWDRLDGFVEAGIMRRHRYSERPELFEYVLTDKGRDLAPALIALTAWGFGGPRRTDNPSGMRTRTAEGRSPGSSYCDRCGRLAGDAPVAARPGPGMPADRAAAMG